jgi:hypothetical protein
LLTAIDAHRDQIASLRADRAQIEAAPRVLADVMTDLDAHLDAIATEAVDALSLHQLRDRRGMSGLKLSESGRADVAVQTLFGLFVATNRAAIRDLIVGQLEDLESARPGMTDADRVARLAELDAEILRAELAEESAIRRLEAQGVSIARRSDLSPLVALAADAALIP